MTTVPYSYKKNDMDEKFNIWFDDMLVSAADTQLDLFTDDSNTLKFDSQGATISQAASSNIWPYTITGTSLGTGSYTLTNGTGPGNISPGLTFSNNWKLAEQSLHVRGDAEFEGDVKIKGKSISETLDKIEQRLAILHPNEKLEDKWLELKKLGDAYRALEKDIIEKEKIWETLKK
jgi:hypothetical protein